MKNKYRILKIAITVILLGFLMNFSLKRFSNKKISDDMVSVKLNDTDTQVYFIDEQDIKNLVDKNVPSRRIGDINIPVLEQTIKNLPAVDSANVYMDLNGHLHLDIRQRVPVFRYNYGDQDYYVDRRGISFPISRTYSHPTMLVTGKITKEEYPKVIDLVDKINEDDFCKKFFVGIAKQKGRFNLLTSDGRYKVELGDLENIEFKIKGFKTFAEKHLVYQDPDKYTKISVRYDNQIVTTLNPNFKENDSILAIGAKELAKNQKQPVIAQNSTKNNTNKNNEKKSN